MIVNEPKLYSDKANFIADSQYTHTLSHCGSVRTLRNVGINANKSVIDMIITDHSGVFVKYHISNQHKDKIK